MLVNRGFCGDLWPSNHEDFFGNANTQNRLNGAAVAYRGLRGGYLAVRQRAFPRTGTGLSGQNGLFTDR